MDEILPNIIGFIVLLIIVVFDWPRALAGFIIGVGARQIGRPWLIIPVGVVLVAGGGELVYQMIGRGQGHPSWQSFGLGVVVAGACAYGLHRMLWRVFDGV